MKILAFDTALEACSAALVDTAAGVLAREQEPMRRGHAEALMPMIARVMEAGGTSFADLARIAVTIGPGTFTGLRVGVAAARGLALAAARPLIGIGTLEALAAGIAETRPGEERRTPFIVALDARRGEIYCQRFAADGAAAGEPALLPPRDAAAWAAGADVILYGSGASLVSAACAEAGRPAHVSAHTVGPGPDPVVIARLAAARPVPGAPVAPLYLRAPDAKPQPGALARADGTGGDLP